MSIIAYKKEKYYKRKTKLVNIGMINPYFFKLPRLFCIINNKQVTKRKESIVELPIYNQIVNNEYMILTDQDIQNFLL